MRDYQFTAAAQRALQAASAWANGEGDVISPPQLLLGLLAEAESRAAEMLTARGIDTAAVLARWPGLVSRDNRGGQARFSAELQDALIAATSHLADFPQPLEFATEHLLLGLIAAENELSAWLSERGFDAKTLADEVCRLYGYGESSGFSVQGSESGGNALCDVPSGAVEQFLSAPHPDLATQPQYATEGVPYRDSRSANVFRVIDAAANRAREGLRVVEDFVRFVWDDRHLMRQCKELRHELAADLSVIAPQDLIALRDTMGDVGTTISTAAERERPDMASVVTANFKRLQESLRSIEEFGKLISPEMAQRIEQLRYRSYTLERAVGATSFGRERLATARLYVLTDGRSSLGEFVDLVQDFITAGVDVLQLRDKQLADAELLARARRLRELTEGTGTLFIMNDRPDLAALSRADGVHVGQEELSVRECRAVVGPRALVGVSTHSLDQARQAVLDGANYIGVGPTFASRTKQFDDAHLRGVELLRAIHAEIRLPAFAIGGIELSNLHEVMATGFTRVAVSGAVLTAAQPDSAARDFASTLHRI